jgi:hypothetical protein
MEKGRAAVAVLWAVVVSLAFALAMRRSSATVCQPIETLAVWG